MPNTTPESKRLRNGILAAVTIVGVTLVALMLVEAYLRVTGFEYELRLHVVESTAPEAEQVLRAFTIDPYLTWVPKRYYENLAHAQRGRVDIIFMGDSCTQFGKYDRDLEAIIRERRGLRVGTLNLGVAGWTTHQGLRQIERDVEAFRPAVVTIYYGWNDHWLSIGLDDKQVNQINASTLRFIQDSRIGQLITKVWVVLWRQKDKPVVRVNETDFHDNLVKIVHRAAEVGATPVLITAPSSHRPGKEPADLAGRWIERISDLIPLHRRYADIVRRVADEQDVILCDLAAAFDRLGENPGELEACFYADGIHFTERGSYTAAQFLYQCMDENGVFDAIGR